MNTEVLVIVLILAIPTYFLIKWVMTKFRIGDDRSVKFLALIPTFILSPIIYVGVVLVWIFTISYYPTKEFDPNEWDSNVQERYKMSEAIIESNMLMGKTRREVISLLGDNYSSNTEKKLTYELGHVPGLLNIDPDFLQITFKNGKVINVEQYEG